MTKEEILNNLWEPTGQDFLTFREDLQLAITLDPSLDKIERAMDYFNDQELSLLTEKYNEAQEDLKSMGELVRRGDEKYAKMELMYEKLANIHSKQEEKYSKLKDFATNIVDYRDNITPLQLHITAIKLLLETGLKEQ